MVSTIDDVVVFGISHEELTTAEREAFIKETPQKIINSLFENREIRGYVNLSTCLRVEFYIELSRGYTIEKLLDNFTLKKGIFLKRGEEAVEHLFRVSCGFLSVIKGEDQILAQIKNAYSSSLENKRTSKILNSVFNKTIELGKKFRTKSRITHNALSLEAISLKFIKNSVKNLTDKKIFILGTGDLAQAILTILVKEKVKKIIITNRTHHKALEIKNIFKGVEVVSFNDKLKYISDSDIIISVTSAPHLVLKEKDIVSLLTENKKYIFLDLAVPRDIEETIGKKENVSLFNLDDIWNVYNEHLVTRSTLIEDYGFLVDEQMKNLKKWFKYYEKGDSYEKGNYR